LLFRIWGDNRKKKDKKDGKMKWVSETAEAKDKAYWAKYVEIHGPEATPTLSHLTPSLPCMQEKARSMAACLSVMGR
jgi:hypothetical protein